MDLEVKGFMGKVLGKFVDIILVLVLFCLVWYLITGIATGKPNVLGYRIFYIPTESMVPVINPGDFVIGVPVDYEDVKIGDIVTYKNQSKGITICHRVVGKIGEGFIFQGDNNATVDEEIVEKEVIGYRIVKIWHRER